MLRRLGVERQDDSIDTVSFDMTGDMSLLIAVLSGTAVGLVALASAWYGTMWSARGRRIVGNSALLYASICSLFAAIFGATFGAAIRLVYLNPRSAWPFVFAAAAPSVELGLFAAGLAFIILRHDL